MSIRYPYTDFHEMNLDWFLSKFQSLLDDWTGVESDFDDIKDAWAIMRNWIEHYFDNLNVQDEIDNKLDEMSGDGSLSALINPVVLETLPPEVVTSTSDMTDPAKTYILKSDSHIYQYVNGAFTDTGVVFGSSIGNVWTFYGNITSPTLAADVPTNSIYEIRVGYVPSDLPVAGTGMLYTAGSGTTYKNQFYIRLTTGKLWYRQWSNSTWGNWIELTMDLSPYMKFDGYLSSNFDADAAAVQTYKLITLPDATVSNLPVQVSGVLYTYGRSGSTRQQEYRTFNEGLIYHRKYSSGAWSTWILSSISYLGLCSGGLLPNSDANYAPGMTMYLHQTNDGTQNVPVDTGAFLITLGQTGTARGQMYINWYTGEQWYRRSTSNSLPTWTSWARVDSGNGNPNATMLSIGNSILTGSVHINGAYDHLSAYNNAPYGVIANAIGVLKNNVTHELHSSAGLIYDGGNGSCLSVIKATDISGYDVIVTQVSYTDMQYPLGNINSVAGDGTIAGAVKDLVDYINTNNPQCQLLLIAAAPDNYNIAGANVFTGLYGNGKSLADQETLLNQLASLEHFKVLGWQDLNLSYVWQNYTDGNNVHFNNEDSYRIAGAHLGGQAAGNIHF